MTYFVDSTEHRSSYSKLLGVEDGKIDGVLLEVVDIKMEKRLAVYASLIPDVSGTVLDNDVCMFPCNHVVVLVRRLVGNVIKICVSDKYGTVAGSYVGMLVSNNVGVIVGVLVDKHVGIYSNDKVGKIVGNKVGILVDGDVARTGFG